MAVKYCTTHRIGYNDSFDPVCPQCMLTGIPAGPTMTEAEFKREELTAQLETLKTLLGVA